MMHIFMLERVCSKVAWCRQEILDAVLDLAIEIGREGREGHRVGTIFTLGRADEVLASSRPLILDPLIGHSTNRTHITDPDLRGTLKELAQLDGAFVIADDGTVVGSCRYLDVPTAGVALGLGLGSRHLAAASASKKLSLIAVVVSQSGIVRVFFDGEEVAAMDAVALRDA